MKTTSSNLKRLSPKDFNATLLEELTRQGRVYVDMPRAVNDDAYKREVMDYVRRIADYATDSWQGGIDGLWEQIVESACFRDCLALKKGLRAGHMNRYTVTNIVCRLQGKGVYRRDVPMLTLHLQLEGTTKRNRYYTSCGNYDLTREAKGVLRELLVRV